MSSRVTRGSVAQAAKVLAEAVNQNGNVSRQFSSPLVVAGGQKKKENPIVKKSTASAKQAVAHDTSDAKTSLPPVINAKKRKRAAVAKVEEDPDELPHNLGKAFVVKNEDPQDTKDQGYDEPASKKQATHKTATKAEINNETIETTENATNEMQENSPVKKSRKRKTNAYGLTPGVSPFPDWPHPTVEECQQVVDLLSQIHGPQIAPATIPTPSLTVSGCGEVPSILDAMIRTLLSAATTGTNSSRAFQGLVDKFGILKEGIGKGSVNWDAVRRAEQKDIFEAIKSGGLAANKSKNIKAILEQVYAENMARRDALVKAQERKDAALAPKGAENESPEQQLVEVVRADQHVLSLDHLHALGTHDAMEAMMQYPGIGVKTSSCVALFCMRRPSLAVDTHVFRLLKWLKWVPPTVKGEIAAFSHVEVRVPDELKYALHQLFIKHGKTCPRCRAATGETSEDWDKGCIIDHLVTRTGKRKGGEGLVMMKKAKAGKEGTAAKKKNNKKKTNVKGKMSEEMDESDISSDLTELDTETENEQTEDDKSIVEKASEGEETIFKKTPSAQSARAAANTKRGKNEAQIGENADLTDSILNSDKEAKNGNGSSIIKEATNGKKTPTEKTAVGAKRGRKPVETKNHEETPPPTSLDIQSEENAPDISKTTTNEEQTSTNKKPTSTSNPKKEAQKHKKPSPTSSTRQRQIRSKT